MREREEVEQYRRKPDFLTGDRHPELNPEMRAKLVDWLISVSEVIMVLLCDEVL